MSHLPPTDQELEAMQRLVAYMRQNERQHYEIEHGVDFETNPELEAAARLHVGHIYQPTCVVQGFLERQPC